MKIVIDYMTATISTSSKEELLELKGCRVPGDRRDPKSLMLEPEREMNLLSSIQKKYVFNADIHKIETLKGKDFSFNDLHFMKSVVRQQRRGAFQNFLAYRINKLEGEYPLNFNQFARYSPASVFVARATQPVPTPRKEAGSWGTYFTYKDSGWRNIFNLKKNVLTLPSGWLREVCKDLYAKGALIDFKDVRENRVTVKDERVYTAGDITLRPDQKKELDTILDSIKGPNANYYFTSVLLDLAVNTGKTYISSVLVKNLNGVKAIVPFRGVTNFRETLVDWLKMGHKVSVICAETSKKGILAACRKGGVDPPSFDTFGDICFVMIPTFMRGKVKYAKNILEKYNTWIMDECHLLASKETKEFINKGKSFLRVGMSGTPLSNADKNITIQVVSLYGKGVVYRSNESNMRQGISLRPNIHFYLNDTRDTRRITKVTKREELIEAEKRMSLLDQILKDFPDRPTVLYTGSLPLEFQDMYYDYVSSLGYDVDYANGKDTKKAQEVIDRFRAGDLHIAVFNRIIKQGINIKNIELCVNLDPTTNEVSSVQAIVGRSIRLNGDAVSVDIVDFWDVAKPYLDHSYARKRIYEREGGVFLPKFDWEAYKKIKLI